MRNESTTRSRARASELGYPKVTETAPVRTGRQEISPMRAATAAIQETDRHHKQQRRRSSYEHEENREERGRSPACLTGHREHLLPTGATGDHFAHSGEPAARGTAHSQLPAGPGHPRG